MEIRKDDIWNSIIGAEDFESFQKNLLQPVYLKQNVTADVREMARLVEKLLLHSYYEYEFIDIAITHAIFAFEKALKKRWSEIHSNSTKLNLFQLIDWFYNEDYFEPFNKEIPHQLRHIRNSKAHDERKSIGGLGFIQRVYNTFDLINDLYEDTSLRKARKIEINNLATELSKFSKGGLLLNYHNQQILIVGCFPIFIDNKAPTKSLYFSCCPIFDLAPFEKGEYCKLKHISISVSEWNFDRDTFTGRELITGENIVLERTMDDENRGKLDLWQKRFYAISSWSSILFFMTEPINILFLKAIRDFHKR